MQRGETKRLSVLFATFELAKAIASFNPFKIAKATAGLALAVATPAFKKGTKGKHNTPSTGFVAGEAGREAMQLSTGQMLMVDKPTYFEGKQFGNARIWNNPETERMMKANNGGAPMIDYSSKFDSLERAIKNKPVSNVTLTPIGIRHQTIKANRITNRLERI